MTPSWSWLIPLSFVLVPLFAVSSLLLVLGSRRYRFFSGGVQGVTGGLGSGKSMFAVSKVLRPAARSLASKRGLWCEHSGREVKRIITNFSFDPAAFGYPGVEVVQLEPVPDMSLWEQIIRQGRHIDGDYRLDAVVAVDECSLFAPSDEPRVDPMAKRFIVHARKLNCELIWMAQDSMQVHKRIRALTPRVWWLQQNDRGVFSVLPGRWFKAAGYRGTDEKMLSVLDVRNVRGSKKVYAAYNSFEVITDDFEGFGIDLDEVSTDQADSSAKNATTPGVGPGAVLRTELRSVNANAS